ncbi:MAG: PfkB family carbohydrate kinase [Gemmatimonadota bacterium]|nr:PfkB family carbohydrate kinase [Gemmatimonadota bacterium]
MSPSGRAVGITGTAVEDTIESPDGSVTEDMGGIYYAVIALDALLPAADRVVPVAVVGEDAVETVRADFGELDRVATEGLRPVAATNNKVHIAYRGPDEREETLTGGVPPIEWPALEPWIGRLDAWLWNFVAGNETDLETFARLKTRFEGPVHLDVHSLCLEHPRGGPRRPRRPDRWERWVEGARWVQCNEREAGLLWSAEDAPLGSEEEAALAERIRSLGAEGLLVTRGEGGATWHGGERRIDVPAVEVEGPVDPTGCGDVAGAAWVAFRWGHAMEPGEALERVVRAAGAAASVSGTRELEDVLRASSLSTNGGSP